MFWDLVNCKNSVRIKNILYTTGGFRGADYNLIEFISAREITSMKRAAKAAPAVSTGVAEKGVLSSDRLVVDLLKSLMAAPEQRYC